MTQDQCFDNGHQATSNNLFTNDQVSDDLNNAKNSIVTNGVNSAVQEFNVDVNSKRSEHRADVAAIVQNRAAEIDADCPPSSKVFATSDQPAATSSDIVNLSVNSKSFTIAPDLNKIECSNNILLTDMTVITHQNSSENIRDIIANSDQVHKDAIDSQLTEVGNNVKSEQNSENGNSVDRSGAVKKKLISSKRERNNEGESDKPEDPVTRLNKLRASISSALSEVKGVLKQYSTEQSLDGENESTPSLQPAEDGPVRFRFVRKVRRRSAYSEDDTAGASEKNETNQEIKPETTPTLINAGTKRNDDFNKILPDNAKSDNEKTSSLTIKTEVVSDKISNISKGDHVPDQPKDTEKIKKDSIHPAQIAEEMQEDKTQHSEQNEEDVSLTDTKSTPQADKIESDITTAPITGNCHATNVIDQTPPTNAPEEGKKTETSTVAVSNQIKQTPDPSVHTTATSSTVIKAKTVKLKKVVKKDRRASIAAVEANQVLPDKSISQVVLKTQRRPSDSGTLVKQPPPVKQKPRISEKSKSHPQRPPKAAAISKAEVPAAPAPNVSVSLQCQSSISSEKSLEPTPNKTILSTTAHEQVLATKPNEPPPPLQQVSTASVIKKQVPAVTELKVLPDKQPQSKTTSPTAAHDEVPVTESNEIPEKVEDPRTTQTVNEPNQLEVVKAITQVAVKSQPKSGSEKSIVHKAKNTVESNDKSTKITELLPATQNKDEQLMPTSEKTAVPAPKETQVHTATEVPQPLGDVPSDETANESNSPDQTKADDHMWFEEDDTGASKCETQPEVPSAPPKKKRKAKRKVVIRRIKRKLSKDDTFIHTQEAPAELEIEEKEIEEKYPDDEEGDELEIVPKQPKPCLKARQFEIGDVVMYAERYKKTQVKWKKAIVMERITSISYKLDIDGEEKPAHISYIKKFTDRKVNFGGKEYLEIDYAQIEEDEEKERNYSIWNLV